MVLFAGLVIGRLRRAIPGGQAEEDRGDAGGERDDCLGSGLAEGDARPAEEAADACDAGEQASR